MAGINGDPGINLNLNVSGGSSGELHIQDNGNNVLKVDSNGKIFAGGTSAVVIEGTQSVPFVTLTDGSKPIHFQWNSGASRHVIKSDEVLQLHGDNITLKTSSSSGDIAFFRVQTTDVAKISYESVQGVVKLEQVKASTALEVENTSGALTVSASGKATLRSTGGQVDVTASGDITIDSSGGDVNIEADEAVTIEAKDGDLVLKASHAFAPIGNIEIDAVGSITVDSSDAGITLTCAESLKVQFGWAGGSAGAAAVSFHRTNTNSDAHEVFKIAEKGTVRMSYSDETTNRNDATVQVQPGLDTVFGSGHYDSEIVVGIDDEYRGLLRLDREAGADPRQGQLVLYDQDGVAWYLWAGTDGKLYMDSTDPQRTDTVSGKLVGEQT